MSEEVLRLAGLRKSYNVGLPTELEVLHGLDLMLGRSDFASLVGPSGSGKSTLLNLLGLLDAGAVFQSNFISLADFGTDVDFSDAVFHCRAHVIGFDP